MLHTLRYSINRVTLPARSSFTASHTDFLLVKYTQLYKSDTELSTVALIYSYKCCYCMHLVILIISRLSFVQCSLQSSYQPTLSPLSPPSFSTSSSSTSSGIPKIHIHILWETFCINLDRESYPQVFVESIWPAGKFFNSGSSLTQATGMFRPTTHNHPTSLFFPSNVTQIFYLRIWTLHPSYTSSTFIYLKITVM